MLSSSTHKPQGQGLASDATASLDSSGGSVESPLGSDESRESIPIVLPKPAVVAQPGIPQAVPYTQPSPAPSTTLQGRFQHRMWTALREGGRQRLVRCIRGHCLERSRLEKSKSWKDVVQDFDSGQHYMLIMLYMHPVDILLFLIENSILYNRERDVDVDH